MHVKHAAFLSALSPQGGDHYSVFFYPDVRFRCQTTLFDASGKTRPFAPTGVGGFVVFSGLICFASSFFASILLVYILTYVHG